MTKYTPRGKIPLRGKYAPGKYAPTLELGILPTSVNITLMGQMRLHDEFTPRGIFAPMGKFAPRGTLMHINGAQVF